MMKSGPVGEQSDGARGGRRARGLPSAPPLNNGEDAPLGGALQWGLEEADGKGAAQSPTAAVCASTVSSRASSFAFARRWI